MSENKNLEELLKRPQKKEPKELEELLKRPEVKNHKNGSGFNRLVAVGAAGLVIAGGAFFLKDNLNFNSNSRSMNQVLEIVDDNIVTKNESELLSKISLDIYENKNESDNFIMEQIASYFSAVKSFKDIKTKTTSLNKADIRSQILKLDEDAKKNFPIFQSVITKTLEDFSYEILEKQDARFEKKKVADGYWDKKWVDPKYEKVKVSDEVKSKTWIPDKYETVKVDKGHFKTEWVESVYEKKWVKNSYSAGEFLDDWVAAAKKNDAPFGRVMDMFGYKAKDHPEGHYENVLVKAGHNKKTWVPKIVEEKKLVEKGHYEEQVTQPARYENRIVEKGHYEKIWIKKPEYKNVKVEDAHYNKYLYTPFTDKKTLIDDFVAIK
ncbi:hypothetical protein C0585_07260 [Candidatus Woesearchaeota archaeon]|nr:MAG: hypothetical protein C0585_07260 [Candidatus Woesearchaeota archaeon]